MGGSGKANALKRGNIRKGHPTALPLLAMNSMPVNIYTHTHMHVCLKKGVWEAWTLHFGRSNHVGHARDKSTVQHGMGTARLLYGHV